MQLLRSGLYTSSNNWVESALLEGLVVQLVVILDSMSWLVEVEGDGDGDDDSWLWLWLCFLDFVASVVFLLLRRLLMREARGEFEET